MRQFLLAPGTLLVRSRGRSAQKTEDGFQAVLGAFAAYKE